MKAFHHFGKNKTVTATALGVSVRTLHNKFEEYEAEDRRVKEENEERRRKNQEFLERARGIHAKPAVEHSGGEPMPLPEQFDVSGMSQNEVTNIRTKKVR